ncbi:MAG: hypothetical protein GY710_15615 [Desulfobacteraceae bacterium]|nr:hypothetical protein [Desulfobacteraceae bacterium]
MKKISRILLLIFVFVFINTSFTIASGFGENYSGNGNELDLSQLEIGDIILTNDAFPYTQKLIPGFWDHSSMYIGDGEIIESWGTNVRIMPVEITLTASAAAIYRVNTTDEIKQAAVEHNLDQVGKLYDLSVAIWPGHKNENSIAWYCSELNWAGYYLQGVDIDDNDGYYKSYWYNVAPVEIAEDDDTYLVSFSE